MLPLVLGQPARCLPAHCDPSTTQARIPAHGGPPVGRLAPDQRVRPLEHVVGDLLAAVCRQTVQDDGVGRRLLDQVAVDGEAREGGQACRPLLLLAHARPHVGVEHVGALGGATGVVGHLHGPTPPHAVTECLQLGQLVAGEGVAGRSGEADLHALEQPALGQRTRHVVGVADVGQRAPGERAQRLAHGQHVGHRLARVRGVAEQVHDRDVEAAPLQGARHAHEHGVLEHPGT